MKAIMVMFDSLNRHMLPPYGCEWVIMPNFERLAERSVIFDNCYAGSLPCIPARRELHTGRYNFLHRSWGPIEPFDDSMPQILKEYGIYTHLSTDHQHYWEEGGSTYHQRYNTWFFARGQEGDPWKAQVKDPIIPKSPKRRKSLTWRQDWVNRGFIKELADYPQARTFADGVDFLRRNHQEDNWFLQIESFDPHEPFFVPERFKKPYPHKYDGPHFDWPDYYIVTEPDDQVQHLRYEYAASLSACDHYLGAILDLMDEFQLWDDTLLIVNTDHGFLLSEHGFWAKNYQPVYNEIAHIPLFIWDPRCGARGERRSSLVQTIDIAPTLLEYFDIEEPPHIQGVALRQTIATDKSIRKAALFGYHGCHVNVTDGRYVYMRGPVNQDNSPLYEYTLMPTHIKSLFAVEELQDIELVEPFGFTKGCRLLKIEGLGSVGTLNPYLWDSQLFDLQTDPGQERTIVNSEIETHMLELMVGLMEQNEAPIDQYMRMGLPVDGQVTESNLALERVARTNDQLDGVQFTWQGKGEKMYYTLRNLLPFWLRRQFTSAMAGMIHERELKTLDEVQVLELALLAAPASAVSYLKLMSNIVVEKG